MSKRYKTIDIMKKLVGLTAIVILFSLTITAQGKKERVRKGAEFTSEQQATLQVKKLTLKLDLDDNQQKAIYEIMKLNAVERQKKREIFQKNKQDGVQLTSDERFEFQNNRLERKIEQKTALKKILNEEQFEKWTKINNVQKRKGQENMKKRRAAKNKSRGQRDGKSGRQIRNQD